MNDDEVARHAAAMVDGDVATAEAIDDTDLARETSRAAARLLVENAADHDVALHGEAAVWPKAQRALVALAARPGADSKALSAALLRCCIYEPIFGDGPFLDVATLRLIVTHHGATVEALIALDLHRDFASGLHETRLSPPWPRSTDGTKSWILAAFTMLTGPESARWLRLLLRHEPRSFVARLPPEWRLPEWPPADWILRFDVLDDTFAIVEDGGATASILGSMINPDFPPPREAAPALVRFVCRGTEAEREHQRPSVVQATRVLEVLRSGDPQRDAPLFWWAPETPAQLGALRTLIELSAPAGSRDAVVDAAAAQGLAAPGLAATLCVEPEGDRPLWADRDEPWVVAEVREDGASRTVIAVHPQHGRRDAAIEVVADTEANVATWARDEQDEWVGRDARGAAVRTVRDLGVLKLDLTAEAPPWFVHDRVPPHDDAPPEDVLAPVGPEELRALAERGSSLREQRAAMRAGLRQRGVGDYAASVFLQHVRDALVLREAKTPGRSRLGGAGRLPTGVGWPRYGNDWCLTFLAELALDELPHLAPLPDAGTLLLFQESETWNGQADPLVGTRAFYVPEGEAIVDGTCAGSEFEELETKFVRGVLTALPGDMQVVCDELPFLQDEQKRLQAAAEELFAHEWGVHWLLGPRRSAKGSLDDDVPSALAEAAPESLARFTPEEAAGSGWRHLLQLNDDEEVGLDFLGCAAHVYILEADLATRRFDRVVAIGYF